MSSIVNKIKEVVNPDKHGDSHGHHHNDRHDNVSSQPRTDASSGAFGSTGTQAGVGGTQGYDRQTAGQTGRTTGQASRNSQIQADQTAGGPDGSDSYTYGGADASSGGVGNLSGGGIGSGGAVGGRTAQDQSFASGGSQDDSYGSSNVGGRNTSGTTGSRLAQDPSFASSGGGVGGLQDDSVGGNGNSFGARVKNTAQQYGDKLTGSGTSGATSGRTGGRGGTGTFDGNDPSYYNTSSTDTGSVDPTDAAHVPPSVLRKHLGEPSIAHGDQGHDRARRNSSNTHQESFRGI